METHRIEGDAREAPLGQSICYHGVMRLLPLLVAACTSGKGDDSAGPLPGEQGGPRPACERPDVTEDAVPVVVVEAGWSDPAPLPSPLTTNCPEDCPDVSPDGAVLFLCLLDDTYDSDDVDWGAFMSNPAVGTFSSVWSGDAWSAPTWEELGVGWSASADMSTSRASGGSPAVFHSARDGNVAGQELFVASWEGDAWSEAERFGPAINDGLSAGEACISEDGDVVIFASARDGGEGGLDLWVTVSEGGEWGDPANLGPPINTAADEAQCHLHDGGSELLFARSGSICRAARASEAAWVDDAWDEPTTVVWGAVGEPSLTADGDTLYFTHVYLDSAGARLDADVYVMTR